MSGTPMPSQRSLRLLPRLVANGFSAHVPSAVNTCLAPPWLRLMPIRRRRRERSGSRAPITCSNSVCTPESVQFSRKGGNQNADKNTRCHLRRRALDGEAPRSAAPVGCCSRAPHPSIASLGRGLSSLQSRESSRLFNITVRNVCGVPASVHFRDGPVAQLGHCRGATRTSARRSMPCKATLPRRPMAHASRQGSGFLPGFDWFSIGLHACRPSELGRIAGSSAAAWRLGLLMAGGLP